MAHSGNKIISRPVFFRKHPVIAISIVSDGRSAYQDFRPGIKCRCCPGNQQCPFYPAFKDSFFFLFCPSALSYIFAGKMDDCIDSAKVSRIQTAGAGVPPDFFFFRKRSPSDQSGNMIPPGCQKRNQRGTDNTACA